MRRIRFGTLFILLAIIAACGFVGHLDKQRLETERLQYCRMHEMFIQSGGVVGWPDYNGSYKEECK